MGFYVVEEKIYVIEATYKYECIYWDVSEYVAYTSYVYRVCLWVVCQWLYESITLFLVIGGIPITCVSHHVVLVLRNFVVDGCLCDMWTK